MNRNEVSRDAASDAILAGAQERLDPRRAAASQVVAIHRQKAPERTILGKRDSETWKEIDEALDAAERDEERLPPHYRDTLLPAGTLVTAAFIDATEANIGGAAKWLALFRITGCPNAPEIASRVNGQTILRSYNPPRRDWLSRNHALFGDWLAVTGRPLRTVPKRSARAILGAFLRDVEVIAATRIVNRRMDREKRIWVATPSEDHYSVIDRFLRLSAGCPRVNQREKK